MAASSQAVEAAQAIAQPVSEPAARRFRPNWPRIGVLVGTALLWTLIIVGVRAVVFHHPVPGLSVVLKSFSRGYGLS